MLKNMLNYSEIHNVDVVNAYNPKQQPSFSPYENNQGSAVAIAGPDFVVIASDTRLCSGYSIYTREQPKLFKLSGKTVLASTGCWCDVLTFTRVLEARMKMYEHEHNKVMSTSAVSQLMATMLYHKRFFPYYIFNVLAGLDEDGKGVIFCYDCVGHKSTDSCIAVGSSTSLIQPFLDNQVGGKNIEGKDPTPMTLDRAVTIVRDVFTASAERDIHTGDSVVIYAITKDGIKEERHPLRRD